MIYPTVLRWSLLIPTNTTQSAGGGASSASIPRGQITFRYQDPFPARTVKELVYKHDITAHTDPGSNNQAGTPLTFNLGSLFAPIAGGHQPFGFDQMAALYARYKVHKVKIRVETFMNSATSVAGAVQVIGIFPPGSSQTTLNVLNAYAMGENYNVSTNVIQFNAVRPVVYETTLDIATIAGLTKKEFEANIEDYSALVSASPTRFPFLEVNLAPFTAANGDLYSSGVTLTFVAEFWQRISLAQS